MSLLYNILKKVYLFTSKTSQSVISLLSVCLFSTFSAANYFKKISNSRLNDDCIILGNGPSLKKELEGNIGEFCNKDVFALNAMCKSDAYRVIKPMYYVLLDSIIWTPTWSEYNFVIDGLLATDWEMTLFIPNSCPKNYYSKFKANSKLKIVIYNGTRITGFSRVSFLLYKNCLGIPSSRNVLIVAIMCSINCGYKKIMLFGTEHSWTRELYADENNRIYYEDNHFFEENVKRYLPRGSYREYLLQYYQTFLAHHIMSIYAVYRDVKIINKTKNSFIEEYETENNE